MGNLDVVVVFNNGEVSFLLISPDSREEAIIISMEKWYQYTKDMEQLADKPEELNFEIKSINVYEIYKEQ